MRVPFDGDEVEDVTPNLPPYTLSGVGLSRDGHWLALNPVSQVGFQLRSAAYEVGSIPTICMYGGSGSGLRWIDMPNLRITPIDAALS